MPYVMVPVPEEHVEEALEAVLRITRDARLTKWDQEAMNGFFADLDESAKALLSLVSRATVANKQISQAGAADRMEVTQREVLGIVRDVNHQAKEINRPPLLISQEATETLPNGRTRNVAIISTNKEAALFVQSAEKDEIQGAAGAGPAPEGGPA
ncbi:MAG: hypothetical protein GX643_02140 [Acidimicrobiales bacterium]|nr:hypothetical protein [Acidimicrobiales bacterium]